MRRSLATKLIALILAGVALAATLTGWLGARSARDALIEAQTAALTGLVASRRDYVEHYFGIVRGQIDALARDPTLIDAAVAFTEAFRALPLEDVRNFAVGGELESSLRSYYEGEFRERYERASGAEWRGFEFYVPLSASAAALQATYIANNPYPIGQKQLLRDGGRGTRYDAIHAEFHEQMIGIREVFGFHDVFLFNIAGHMVYSVYKETDFATSFRSGPYRDSNLGRLIREVIANPDAEGAHIVDFEPYAPSYGAPASFIAAPVFADDELIGVAAFQLPIDEINMIMSDGAGLGETGETILVGGDGLLRSDSRFSDTSTMMQTAGRSEAAQRALNGTEGVFQGAGYRGGEVVSAFAPLAIDGLHWAIVAEVSAAEVAAPVQALQRRILLFGIVLAAAVGLVSLWLMRRLVLRPVRRLSIAAERAGNGDFSQRVDVSSKDELGLLGKAFNTMSAAIERDIADRERAARDLEAARDEAECANRAKSTFLANMSHELRTPLNAVIGYSEMLTEELEEEGRSEYVGDLEKINAAGKHLLGLINDVLDLSKIEAGRMDLYLERFDVRQMLEDAASTVMPLIDKNGNRLVPEYDEELGTARADVTKLRQALFNLLSNAAKFTEDGEITLRARRETTDGTDELLIEVADSGIGIPEDKIGHVFEEFAQADDSTTRNYGGTGLGLPISRRFCRMMGGDIVVRSVVGEGSVFAIRIPVEVGAQARPEESPVEAVAEGAVLVIDDDAGARELIRRTLEQAGYEAVLAGSGEAGLDLARRISPALITLDVMMPGIDGWTVLRELKSDPATAAIPVIMVSVLAEKGLGFALGATEYLTKPLDRDRFRAVVQEFAPLHGAGHALVVEDDAAARDLARRALEEDGWRVTEAPNGKLGLERFQQDRPDIVVLDLMMPVMDGFEFMERLRGARIDTEVPVLVMTAKDLNDDEKAFLEHHAQLVVSKGQHEEAALMEFVRARLRQTPNGRPTV